jgi:predicted helicase/very-short-patch-repair endonuclease
VRAVDDILKTEFDLPQGLADTSKTKIKVNVQGKTVDQEVHKVQILDPATGTGTFLAETIKHIHKKFKGQQGIWSNYVETHLLPRLNGFELLMASYAMAHLKLDLLLTETGYKPTTNQRFRVYLTNSLEEHHQDTGTLFANWLSSEANEANHIKRDSPVMCVIGNPPYSGISSNNGEWISKLIEDYKYVDGVHFNERKHWLNDDYVKFLRYGQHFIEKNGSGVLAFINPHGFLDNPTFRGMRWNLLKTFDKIYTIDLHGNSKKMETAPDGSVDVNVFDIMQGVSINIFVKTGKKKANEFGKVFHFDLYGKREMKYDFLSDNSLKSINFEELKPQNPSYYFVPKNNIGSVQYDLGFGVNQIFNLFGLPLMTGRDKFSIHFTKASAINLLEKIDKEDIEEIRRKYEYGNDTTNWDFNKVKADFVRNNFDKKIIRIVNYRPFDLRFTFYTGISSGVHSRPQNKLNSNFINDNLGLLIPRQLAGNEFYHIFITNKLTEFCVISNKTKEQNQLFPLYLYPESNAQQTIDQTTERTPNLNTEIVKQIADKLGLTFVPEKNPPLLEGCPSGGVVFSPNPTNTSQKEILTTINNIPIYRNFVENLPHNPALNQLAKDKRKEGILSEVLFWQQVHKGVFYKIDFDRQRIIGNYIVDFYVKALGLVIEIDGNSHDEKQEYDAKRQAYLESFGLKVFRCRDIDVKKNINAVFTALEKFIINEYGEKTTPAFSHPSTGGEFSPIDILDYIYAVLHSPSYREKYKEFLKIDFPRVPYPKDQATFWQLVKLGGEIRQIHLLESPIIENYITEYPINGDNVVGKIRFELSSLEGGLKEGDNNFPNQTEVEKKGEKLGRVYINETQYFDNVPQIAWEFYIGGYQPAQKWLKDRKERKLEFEDILHYQKIIVALSETDRLMKEIDKVAGEW